MSEWTRQDVLRVIREEAQTGNTRLSKIRERFNLKNNDTTKFNLCVADLANEGKVYVHEDFVYLPR